MIYQMADTALNPRKKIGEIIGRPVEFYLGLKGAEKRRRVEKLLEQIELEPSEFINQLPLNFRRTKAADRNCARTCCRAEVHHL